MVVVGCFVGAIGGMFIHEGGHGLVAWWNGARILEIGVMPGIVVYPSCKWVKWGGWVAYIRHTSLPVSQMGWVSLAGSGSTMLVSYVLVWLMGWRRILPWGRIVMWCVAMIFAWDILGYSIFTQLGGRHFWWIGGTSPEPLNGFRKICSATWLYVVLMVLHALCFHGLALWRMRNIVHHMRTHQPST